MADCFSITRRAALKALPIMGAAIAVPAVSVSMPLPGRRAQLELSVENLKKALMDMDGGVWDIEVDQDAGSIFGRRLSPRSI